MLQFLCCAVLCCSMLCYALLFSPCCAALWHFIQLSIRFSVELRGIPYIEFIFRWSWVRLDLHRRGVLRLRVLRLRRLLLHIRPRDLRRLRRHLRDDVLLLADSCTHAGSDWTLSQPFCGTHTESHPTSSRHGLLLPSLLRLVLHLRG